MTLLVLTADPVVTRWAKKPIDLGHPGFRLEPVVIELEDVPGSIDPALAQKLPELAVLSAIAHPDLATAETAFEAIKPLPKDQKQLYFDIIRSSLPAAVRQILESPMLKGYKYQSEFAQMYFQQGHDEGREEGLNQGLEKGLAQGLTQGLEKGLTQGLEKGLTQGRKQGLHAALRMLARARLAAVTADDEAAIAALDERALTELIAALGEAGDGAQARREFDDVIRKYRGT